MSEATPKLGTVRYIASGGKHRPQERYGKGGWKPFCCDYCGNGPEERVPFKACPKCGADYTVRLMVGPKMVVR